ncbi:MAG TPA: condensation domain-containing protein, partial [Chloroflexota bacterium]|nr:condensation domain-containing protein [Chloroflexota bacterium]
KVRGFRIELGEVEAALREHPGVREAVVVVKEDRPGDQRLVAYVVPAPDASVNGIEMELAAFLNTKLPQYMVPSAYVCLEHFPLTPNGKLDRSALPDPPITEAPEATEPRTAVERRLVDIVAGVLGRPRVGLHDNFFLLGGHSLLAMQVIARLRADLGVEIPARALFDRATLAELAAQIEEATARAREQAVAEIRPRQAWELAPASMAQRQIWIAHELVRGAPVYNESCTIRHQGQLDVGALERAWNELLRRHEAWRTVFVWQAGEPWQVVQPAAYQPLPVVELGEMPVEQREAEALRLAQAQARRPFDLTSGPLVRALLVRLSEAEQRLYLTLHHIIADGLSLSGVFLPELAALYEAFSRGQPSPLPELPVQYGDFAVWEREARSEAAVADDLAYWRRQMTGPLPRLALPEDHPTPARRTFAGAVQPLTLPAELTARLSELSRRHGVTLFTTLLASFMALLGRYTGQDDIPVVTFSAGRERPELERLLGLFIHTLVIRGDLSGDPSFEELLRRVREVTLEAYAHEKLPFQRLVQELQEQQPTNQTPLRVMFHLDPEPAQGFGEWQLSWLDVHTDTAKSDLNVDLEYGPEGDGLVGWIEYSTDLFEPDSIARLVGHWQTLLEGVVAGVEQRLSALPLLTDDERQQLVRWNDTAADYELDVSLAELFERQAERTPGGVALACGDERLTYVALNERANRLARHLTRRGVCPGALVGLSLGRTPDMVVALLAVLKAGAAYVPLDPAYPQERLRFMVQDARLRVIVTADRWATGLAGTSAELVLLDAEAE